VLEMASAGLAARAEVNSMGDNEVGFLKPLRDIVAEGKTPAERLLERFTGEWGGEIDRVYAEKSF